MRVRILAEACDGLVIDEHACGRVNVERLLDPARGRASVGHLSRALDRCTCAGVSQPTILEVGAGNGMLAHHLARRLEGRACVVAVDDGSSRIATQAEVHVLDQATALERFAPQIVLACWMPVCHNFEELMFDVDMMDEQDEQK